MVQALRLLAQEEEEGDQGEQFRSRTFLFWFTLRCSFREKGIMGPFLQLTPAAFIINIYYGRLAQSSVLFLFPFCSGFITSTLEHVPPEAYVGVFYRYSSKVFSPSYYEKRKPGFLVLSCVSDVLMRSSTSLQHVISEKSLESSQWHFLALRPWLGCS